MERPDERVFMLLTEGESSASTTSRAQKAGAAHRGRNDRHEIESQRIFFLKRRRRWTRREARTRRENG